MALYRIGTVARLSGVPIDTLRNWERRYGLVIASRSEGRHRLYSPDDVERVRLLKHWIDDGFSAGEAHALLQERERRGIPPATTTGAWVREDARRARASAAAASARAEAQRTRAVEMREAVAARRRRRNAGGDWRV